LEGLATLKPVIQDGVITADIASQVSDGASPSGVPMERSMAESWACSH
jgi:acetyl-CoA acetyltransferase